MKRTIKLNYSNKATIPTGVQYENQSPCYVIDSEYQIDEKDDFNLESEFALMKAYVDGMIQRDIEQMSDFRAKQSLPSDWFRVIGGQKYIRVTKVITPDTPPIPYIEDHAELGTHLDMVFKKYSQSRVLEFAPYQDKGNIKCTWDMLFKKTQEWVSKYGYSFEFTDSGREVKNDEFLYAGELDLLGAYTDKDGLRFIIADVKKTEKLTKDLKEKYFMQQAAYVMALPENERPSTMCIISPFNEPVFSEDIAGHFELFKQKRQQFKEKYGV